MPVKLPVVGVSDGAGKVVAIGSKVTEFSEGDNVIMAFYQGHQDGALTQAARETDLGGKMDGCLRHYAVFPETGLVLAPSNLNPIEGATLPGAPLTSWNALYGILSKALKPGEVVLTQGTGAVSLSAIQFAKAAGATVIATTSSDEKAEFLKKLGADFIIDYKKDPNWGETAKNLTPGKEGVDHILEVGGPATMEQSLKGLSTIPISLLIFHAPSRSIHTDIPDTAIKLEGVINVIGFLTGVKAENEPSTLAALNAGCIFRGILVGSRTQLVSMSRAIEANNIHPIVDEKVFRFEDALQAYEYQWQQKNFGKVVVQL